MDRTARVVWDHPLICISRVMHSFTPMGETGLQIAFRPVLILSSDRISVEPGIAE